LSIWAQTSAGFFSSRAHPAGEIASQPRPEPQIPAGQMAGQVARRLSTAGWRCRCILGWSEQASKTTTPRRTATVRTGGDRSWSSRIASHSCQRADPSPRSRTVAEPAAALTGVAPVRRVELAGAFRLPRRPAPVAARMPARPRGKADQA
jgi:hypothetical protein